VSGWSCAPSESILLHVKDGLVGARGYAGRQLAVWAEVALGDDASLKVALDSAIGAGKDAGPAADTACLIDVHFARRRVAMESTCEAGVDAEGLGTVAALDGQEEVIPPLDAETSQGNRLLLQVGLDDISSAGMLNQAEDLAEAAAHAQFFLRIDSPDGGPGSVTGGCAAQGLILLRCEAVRLRAAV
jgi:hypothetical protein